jgi:hypothetical protein
MAHLDAAVRAAADAGIGVMIDPAFSAPLWATSGLRPHPQAPGYWYNRDIDVRQAAAWEGMLAARYSGRYTPPGEHSPLPRASAFTLWNEPNLQSEITPQWRAGVPVSADWARTLAQLAYPAIKRQSPTAAVLIGNTSDAGSDAEQPGAGVAPLAFIRRLACVDRRLQPVGDGSCAHFVPVPADGYAHHPYERDALPWVRSGAGQAGWAQMGDLPQLQVLLDRLVVLGRLAPGAGALWLTEQGYASNGELRDMPWSEPQQAALNADAEYLAWRNPQTASFAQFLLRDTLTRETLALRARTASPHVLVPGTWSTGLIREDLRPKPAWSMFRDPVVARVLGAVTGGFRTLPDAGPGPAPLGAGLEIWGHARPARAALPVEIEMASGSGPRTVWTGFSAPDGTFDVDVPVPVPLAPVRYRWAQGDEWQSSPWVQPAIVPVPCAAPGVQTGGCLP